jgi:site-specific DNA-methyltransferase (adenine-specific)
MSSEALAPRLSTQERKRLAELEQVVEEDLGRFVAVGRALLEIRDQRLYRETHARFRDYLEERWSISRSRGYQLIDAAKVSELVSTMVDTPPNERQTRELVPLLREDEQVLVTVWRELKTTYGDNLTTASVRDAVDRYVIAERSRLATARSDALRAERQAEDAATGNGIVTFRHGDFRDLVCTLADGSVALLLTDPPYGIDYQGRPYFFQQGTIPGDRTPQEAADLLAEALCLLRSKLAATAHVLVFTGWRQEPITRSLLEAADLTLRSSLVWAKDGHGVGDWRHAFGPAHERIVHATAGDARMRYRQPDVLRYPRVKRHQHPTEKPVELLEQLIRATSNPGQLVCDPVCGVASTLIAAIRTGRRGWGSELDRDYYARGEARLATAVAEAKTGAAG